MIKQISVIVPTRHRDDMLAQCLDRLAPGAQTLPFSEYELIITDNGQTSTAQEMVARRYPWAKWVKGPGGGPADNRNNGARHASGDWLAFIDDDCLPEADWLEGYINVRDGGASNVRALEGAIDAIGDMGDQMAECPVNLHGNCFWTANVFIEHQLFDEVGGFDASFPKSGGEDYDLYLRLKAKTELPFVPQARVSHPVRILSVQEAIASALAANLVWAHCIHLHPNEMLAGKSTPAEITWYMFKSQLKSAWSKLVLGQFRRAYAVLAATPRATVAIFRHLQGLTKKIRA